MKFLLSIAYGSVYALVDGELIGFCLRADNTFDTSEPVAVDFDRVDSEELREELLRIRKFLS